MSLTQHKAWIRQDANISPRLYSKYTIEAALNGEICASPAGANYVARPPK